MHDATKDYASRIRAEFPRGVELRFDATGQSLTTFALGGEVALLLEPDSLETLKDILAFLRFQRIPWRIIGGGSNLVISDSGVGELVIRLGPGFNFSCLIEDEEAFLDQLRNSTSSWPRLGSDVPPHSYPLPSEILSRDVASVFALGSAPLMGISRRMSQLGLSGLEFAAGIPAQVGGAIYMNAGAHDHSISEIISSVLLLDNEGKLLIKSNEQMGFSYRHSAVGNGMVIIGAVFKLCRKPPAEVREVRNRCLAYRKASQPLHLPSAGSVFVNPERAASLGKESGLFAAQLLEQLGFKGVSQGGVAYSLMHANWLVKTGQNATAADVLALMSEGERRVLERFGIKLQREIIVWDDERKAE